MADDKHEDDKSVADLLREMDAEAKRNGNTEQSLAEFLGLIDPLLPPEHQNPVPPPKMTAKALSKGILQSRTYYESILRRILLDTLPSAVELRLHDYAHGKPVEQIEVRELPADLSDLTSEQLKERARQVSERIRDEQAVEAELVTVEEKVH